ncbi:hypothetical protein Tco_0967650 [Tanacetum coccineum]
MARKGKINVLKSEPKSLPMVLAAGRWLPIEEELLATHVTLDVYEDNMSEKNLGEAAPEQVDLTGDVHGVARGGSISVPGCGALRGVVSECAHPRRLESIFLSNGENYKDDLQGQGRWGACDGRIMKCKSCRGGCCGATWRNFNDILAVRQPSIEFTIIFANLYR